MGNVETIELDEGQVLQRRGVKFTNALVVYYSRTGNTKTAAEKLATILNADLVRIMNRDNYKGIIGFIRCGFEAAMGRDAAIADMSIDFGAYDQVVVCTPVWAGKMSSPVRSFLKKYGTSIRSVAYLITRGDANKEYLEICSHMNALVDKNHLAAISLKGGHDLDLEKLNEFAASLRR